MGSFADIWSYDFGSYLDSDWDDHAKEGTVTETGEHIAIDEIDSGEVHWQSQDIDVDRDANFPLYLAVCIQSKERAKTACCFRLVDNSGTEYYIGIGTSGELEWNTDLDVMYEQASAISQLITTTDFRVTLHTDIDGDGDGDFTWLILKLNVDDTIDLYKYKNNAFANNGDISDMINDYVLVASNITRTWSGCISITEVHFFGEGYYPAVPPADFLSVLGFGKIQIFQKEIVYFDKSAFDIPTIRVKNKINIGGSGYLELIDHERENLAAVRASNREIVSIEEKRHGNTVYRGEIGEISTKRDLLVVQLKDYLKKMNRIKVDYNPVAQQKYLKHIVGGSFLYYPKSYSLQAASIGKQVVIIRKQLKSQKVAPFAVSYDITPDHSYGVIAQLGFYDETYPMELNGVGAFNNSDGFKTILDFKIVIPTGATITGFNIETIFRTTIDTVDSRLLLYDSSLATYEEVFEPEESTVEGDFYPYSGETVQRYLPLHEVVVTKGDDDDPDHYFYLQDTNNAFGKDVYTLRLAVYSEKSHYAGIIYHAISSIDKALLSVDFDIPHNDTVGIDTTVIDSEIFSDSTRKITLSNNNLQDAGFSIDDIIVTSEFIDEVLIAAFSISDVSNFITSINVDFDANKIVEHEDVSELSFLALIKRYAKILTIIYWYDPFDNSIQVVDNLTSSGTVLEMDDVQSYPRFDFKENTMDVVSKVTLNTPAGIITKTYVPEYESGAEPEDIVIDDSQIETASMLIDAAVTLQKQYQYSKKTLKFLMSLDDLSKQSYAGIRLGRTFAIRFPTAASPTLLDFSSGDEGELTLVGLTYVLTKNLEYYIMEFERIYL